MKTTISILALLISTTLFSCKSEHEKKWEAYKRDKETMEMFHAEQYEKYKQAEREVKREELKRLGEEAPDSSLTKLITKDL